MSVRLRQGRPLSVTTRVGPVGKSSRPRPRRYWSPRPRRRSTLLEADSRLRARRAAPDLEHLFSPLMLGPVELPTRVVSPSHQTTMVHDHLPTPDFVAYHEARAQGGVGLIVLEAMAVPPSGLLPPTPSPATWTAPPPPTARSPPRCGRTARGCSCSCSTAAASRSPRPRARWRSPPRPSRAPASTPSRGRSAPTRSRSSWPAMRAPRGRGRRPRRHRGLGGARLPRRAVLPPELNRRDDATGSAARFPVEVLGAVRRQRPGLALGVRLSADSPPPTGRPGSPRWRRLRHVAVGDSSTFIGCVGIVPPPPAPDNLIGELTAPFRLGPPLGSPRASSTPTRRSGCSPRAAPTRSA